MIAQIDKNYIKKRPYKLYSRLVSYAFFEGRPLTTSGRWINPLVFGLFYLYKLLPQLKKVNSPIFILGTGRSGTTILGIVLSMHKEIGFLNEPKAIWKSINKEDDLIGSYTMYPAKYYLDNKDVTIKRKKQIHKIFGAYLTATFSNRVLDKYPELIFRIPYVLKIFPNAKFLFLVRNGIDTCSSIEKWSSRLGTKNNGETHDWWGINNRKWNLFKNQVLKKDAYFKDIYSVLDNLSNHTDMAVLEWIATMRQGLKIQTKYPNNVLRINFEDLSINPKNEVEKIIGFTNLSNDKRCLDYAEEVLKPTKTVTDFKVHEDISPLFMDTMKKMGY